MRPRFAGLKFAQVIKIKVFHRSIETLLDFLTSHEEPALVDPDLYKFNLLSLTLKARVAPPIGKKRAIAAEECFGG